MANDAQERQGVLLVGHGTRDAQGTAEFLALADLMKRHLAPRAVEACFLELQLPDIATGVRRLRDRGVTSLAVAPLLLFAAGHAKSDIPEAVAAALGDWNPHRVQAAALESHPALVALSQERYATAIGESPAKETAVLLVGRGSSDASALAAFETFAEHRRAQLRGVTVQTAYVAVAEPRFSAAAAALAESNAERIVVQPHLLFHGELMRELRTRVTELQRTTQREWMLTEHLAAGILTAGLGAERLISACSDRILAALQRHT